LDEFVFAYILARITGCGTINHYATSEVLRYKVENGSVVEGRATKNGKDLCRTHEDMGNSHTVLHKELKAQYKSHASDQQYQAMTIQVRSRPIQDLDGCRNASGPALVAVIATWDASRRFESSFYENSSFEQKSCTALRNKKFSLVHS